MPSHEPCTIITRFLPACRTHFLIRWLVVCECEIEREFMIFAPSKHVCLSIRQANTHRACVVLVRQRRCLCSSVAAAVRWRPVLSRTNLNPTCTLVRVYTRGMFWLKTHARTQHARTHKHTQEHSNSAQRVNGLKHTHRYTASEKVRERITMLAVQIYFACDMQISTHMYA